MTYVSGVDVYRKVPANYNAVKIQINNPTTTIPEGFKPTQDDNGIYNAVNIEVNKPMVEVKKDSTYEYANNNNIIPFENAVIQPQNLPKLPVVPLYQTFINNKTLVNAEFEFENPKKNKPEKTNIEKAKAAIEEQPIDDTTTSLPAEILTTEAVKIPEPNFVEVSEIKNIENTNNTSFHGVNFKANENKVEITNIIATKISIFFITNFSSKFSVAHTIVQQLPLFVKYFFDLNIYLSIRK